MNILQKIGASLFSFAFVAWICSNFIGSFQPNDPHLYQAYFTDSIKQQAVLAAFNFEESKQAHYSQVEALSFIKKGLTAAQTALNKSQPADAWSNKLSDYDLKIASFELLKAATQDKERLQTRFYWLLCLALLGAFMYILPELRHPPGIKNNGIFQSSVTARGAIAWALGLFLIAFYIALYFYPQYITNWVVMLDPLGKALNGNGASQWFLYGFLYTVSVVVMGVKMILKYRHNNYQLVRTASVLFFQLCFAFILPQLLEKMQLPSVDLKNMWPLDYSFFFDYRLDKMLHNGTFGIFILVWGVLLFLVGMPVMTYFYGKRWYCSWVCGCGGLAETLGDPFRHLSDKSTTAWKAERYIIYSVTLLVTIMTILVLITYFTGGLGISYQIRDWYGFLIGGVFSGVIGTGLYPILGNRTWCRFGCPLAGYMGLIQRFQSRFRITTNGGQCISCGNCSTYCEQGIDVRAYAQKGQDIVRASCIGCGVCAAVCPRGVLRLENASSDIAQRAVAQRVIHVRSEDVGVL